MFFVNSAIWYLHTNTDPKNSLTTIGLGTHWHTPATTTFYPSSPVDHRLRQSFQLAVTGIQVILDNTNSDTPLLSKNICDLYKLLPLICNLTLNYNTMIDLKSFYGKYTLNLTPSVNQLCNIIPDLHHIYPSK